jgi:hypothetical protein
MTRLIFSITLDISELETLERALSHYQAVCDREIANGANWPFRADIETVQHLLSKRYDWIHTTAGTFSRTQLEEMARTGQFPDGFSDI